MIEFSSLRGSPNTALAGPVAYHVRAPDIEIVAYQQLEIIGI